MEKVIVRFYAAARDAAGSAEITVSPSSLTNLLHDISKDNSRLSQVLQRCSFLLDGAICHDREVVIQAGSTVDVLPPFAGG
ncbi:MAG: MoaD/ThiS family protein [Candidatus Nanopelagicaceae bacterium]